MRRKSKKIKEETRESGSERRSKRSSARRKKAYEDDEEGGSGIEEERTTEEEMTSTKTKDRARRYATRGRKQKAEESEEEEVSQGEEERVDYEEESSNNVPLGSEVDDRESEAVNVCEVSESVDTTTDKSALSGSELIAWKPDNLVWEMKSKKSDQGDKAVGFVEETPAQGEGDDGEEEGSRSHSRKRKLKLSRECLHESREAIPKIRLRLSRNRSGGYETEKLEAERIDTKKSEEETVIEVIKVESTVPEQREGDDEQSTTPVEPDEGEVKAESEEIPEESSEEIEESKAEGVEQTIEEASEEQEPEPEVTADEKPEEEEDSRASTVEEVPVVEEEKVEVQVKVEEKEETNESAVMEEGGVLEAAAASESPKESPEDTRSEGERKAEDAAAEIEEEAVIAVESSAEVVVKKEVEEEKEDVREEMEQETRVEAQEIKEEERISEETQGKQVSVESEVSVVAVIKEEVAKDSDDECKASDDDKEKGVEEEEKGVEEEEKGVEEEEKRLEGEEDENRDKVEEVKESTKVEEVPLDESESIIKNEDGDKEENTKEGNEEKPSSFYDKENEVVGDKEERDSKVKSVERTSRINRSKLRKEEDEGDAQKRRKRSRSRDSSENQKQSTTVPEPQVQPKKVSLKRPKLIRSTSSLPRANNVSSCVEEHKEKEEDVNGKEKEDESEDLADTQVPKEIQNNDQNAIIEDGTKKRRRKWCQQKSQGGPSQTKRPFISISTQSLKGLIPEVKPLPIHELRLSIEKDDIKDICLDEEESCEASEQETIVRTIDANGQNERTVWAQVVDDEMRPSIHPDASRVPVMGAGDAGSSVGPIRRISIVSDDAVRLQRSPSPPRNPPTSVLFLSNLVRPFTVQQLKELLARTGVVVEGGFWIDRIKSMCLVQYETEEQARETRHALHGVRWPISNPKRLWVDFATKERLEEAKREGNVHPPPAIPTTPSLTPPHPPPRDDFPRKTEPLRVDGSGMLPSHHSATHRGVLGSPGRQGHILQQDTIIGGGAAADGAPADNVAWQQRGRPRPEAPPLRPTVNARDFKMTAVPVREWDLDKVVQQSPPRTAVHGPSRGPADERRRPDAGGRRDRMLPSPPPSMQEMQVRKAKRKEAEAAEAPANLLDSLFRKTKATPSIYWLPLTAEQIKVKEEIRRQHLAEHERRMAEMKRAAEKERGSRRRRRSSSPRRRRRSGEVVRKKPSEGMKGHKTGSASPKK